MAVAVIKLALLAALAWTEIAWWEGQWAPQGIICNASSGDRPIRLASSLLDLGEAECVSITEQAFGRDRLCLNATCRDHGDPTPRSRSFVLKPSEGGKAMTMSDGNVLWQLRKCR